MKPPTLNVVYIFIVNYEKANIMTVFFNKNWLTFITLLGKKYIYEFFEN